MFGGPGGTLYSQDTDGSQAIFNSNGQAGYFFDSAGNEVFIGDTTYAINVGAGISNFLKIIISAGTAGSPSISFPTDDDTGLYRSGANVLGFSSGGLSQLTLSTILANFQDNNITTTGNIKATDGNFTGTGTFGNANITGKLVTGNFSLSDTVWEDLTFPMNNLKINPLTSKPDEDTENLFYLFDDASTETIRGTGQTSHSQKNNTGLNCHIHWVQSASGSVNWTLNYTLNNGGQTTGETWRVLTSNTTQYLYSSGNLEQKTNFPATINISGEGLSSIIRFQVSRIGGATFDTMVGDAKFESFDCHYQKDTMGSRDEFIK